MVYCIKYYIILKLRILYQIIKICVFLNTFIGIPICSQFVSPNVKSIKYLYKIKTLTKLCLTQ